MVFIYLTGSKLMIINIMLSEILLNHVIKNTAITMINRKY